MMSFSNKVVIVTGASAGVGAATAILFAEEGANVAMVDRNETALKEVAEKCKRYGKNPLVIKADVSKDYERRSIVNETVDKYGKIDILVNNGGIANLESILNNELLEKYETLMRINQREIVHLTNLAAPYLVESKGNVVNIPSVSGTTIIPKSLAHCVPKAALDHLTYCTFSELVSSGVRVNAISTGPVKTNLYKIDGITILTWKEMEVSTALGKISIPKEIAKLVLFLTSDKGRSISGSIFVLDNGQLVN